jgi:aspartyl-tRNA(Asn)/glutamyl-tRNA(Gln) amidotransferase subunit C
MALSVDEVRRIADLARLRLSPEEETTFAAQLAQIVDYIDQLSAYATAPVDEGALAVPQAQDEVRPFAAVEEMLHNAPALLDRFFLVPQVKSTKDG